MNVKGWPPALLLAVVLATGSAARAQGAPLSAPPASGPYFSPAALASSEYPLPPYPGTAPSTFPSAHDFAEYGAWRMRQLSARERGLTLLGRPEGYRAKRAGGFVMVGGGLGIAVGGGFLLLLSVAASHSSAQPDRAFTLGVGGAALGAIAMAIGGAVWLVRLRRDNRYGEEIAALRSERRRWSTDVQRARHDARNAQGLSLDVEHLLVRF
jgi:hypothetical protein